MERDIMEKEAMKKEVMEKEAMKKEAIERNTGKRDAKKNNYTDFNRKSTKKYASADSLEEAIHFFQHLDSFRSFDQGLKQILIKKGFPGNPDHASELADYLIARLQHIGSSLKPATVTAWFADPPARDVKPRPKIEAKSRSTIYEICFALNLTIEETTWFFEHVYYDRPFNCHTVEEAVYYFAFLHQLGYQEARSLINEIEHASFDGNSRLVSSHSHYTWFVQNQIETFQSAEELKRFLIANKDNFQSWNQSALESLNTLVSRLIAPPGSEHTIKMLKRRLERSIRSSDPSFTIRPSDYQHCGLLLREILYDAPADSERTGETAASCIYQRIHKKSLQSISFLLELLLSDFSGLGKRKQIPYVVRNNFPSKKTLSDILLSEKAATAKSYDAIRKAMILLDFFCFWIPVKLGEGPSDLSKEELAEIYREEADDRLHRCGYHPLYDGNPYDWIFLCSAQSEEPIKYFRDYIGELLSDF